MQAYEDLTTVIVLHSGEVDRLRHTISALVWHTRKPWELIVIVGKDDHESARYLTGVRDASAFRVVTLDADRAACWPPQTSDFLQPARGRRMLFIKSGVVTSELWLEKMGMTLHAAPGIGAVGPMLNVGEPPQLVEGLSSDDVEDFYRFAARWCIGRRATWRRSASISDQCLLVERKTLEELQSSGPVLESVCSGASPSGRFNALSNDTLFYALPPTRRREEPLRERIVRGVVGRGVPEFDARGLLPPGDHLVTFSELRASRLVSRRGDDPRWDEAWRAGLVDNLEHLTRSLKRAGVSHLYIGGSFVEDCGRPSDIDGYFLCDEQAVLGGRLQRKLNSRFGPRIWDWDPARRTPGPGSDGLAKLLMWHRYRVELMPDFGQAIPEFRDRYGNELRYRDAYRMTKGDMYPKGLVKISF